MVAATPRPHLSKFDTRPEFTAYADTGCPKETGGACTSGFHCPFDTCVLDQQHADKPGPWAVQQQGISLARELLASGLTRSTVCQRLARALHVSERTVWRWISQAKAPA